MTATATDLGVRPPSRRRRFPRALANRWPTALAIGMSAATLGGGKSDDSIGGFSEALLLLPMLYVIVAAIRRPQFSWVILGVLLTLVIVLRAVDVVPPSAVLVMVSLVVLVWAGLHGRLHKPDILRLQALGMIGFGAVALVGLAVDPDIGRYLVAAGWFLHGMWDIAHLRADRVVQRSWAEWCAVVDVLIAIQLAFKV